VVIVIGLPGRKRWADEAENTEITMTCDGDGDSDFFQLIHKGRLSFDWFSHRFISVEHQHMLYFQLFVNTFPCIDANPTSQPLTTILL